MACDGLWDVMTPEQVRQPLSLPLPRPAPLCCVTPYSLPFPCPCPCPLCPSTVTDPRSSSLCTSACSVARMAAPSPALLTCSPKTPLPLVCIALPRAVGGARSGWSGNVCLTTVLRVLSCPCCAALTSTSVVVVATGGIDTISVSPCSRSRQGQRTTSR